MTKINLASIGIKLAPKAQPETKAEPEAKAEPKEESQAAPADPTPASKPVGLRIKMAVGTTKVSDEPAKDESKPAEPQPKLGQALQTLSKTEVVGSVDSTELVNITSSAPQDVHIPNFEERLAALDSLFVEGHGYPSLVIDSVRGHIKEIMKELKSSPEMMNIVKADDVRNIMAFVQQSAKDARLGFAEKNEKAVKKTKKKQSQVTFDLSGFKDEVAQQVAKETRSLESLGKANVDTVNLKFKG